MDCFMRQDDTHKVVDGHEVLVNANSGHANSVKMAMCPMKYAGAAMDMLSGVNNAAGVQNTKLPADFQMMFDPNHMATGAYAQAHQQMMAAHNAWNIFNGGTLMTTTIHPMLA